MGQYRIDVVNADELVEIQHGSLAAIRDKTRQLLATHHVRVVKPIIARKHIVRRVGPRTNQCLRRMSPKRGGVCELFGELVYFRSVFPHPRLTIDVPLVEVEEWRRPCLRRRRRRRARDYIVEDQKLVAVSERHTFSTPEDLLRWIPQGLPERFDTADLAKLMQIPRWLAQRVAYCLRESGAVECLAAKRGNTRLYTVRVTAPAQAEPANVAFRSAKGRVTR